MTTEIEITLRHNNGAAREVASRDGRLSWFDDGSADGTIRADEKDVCNCYGDLEYHAWDADGKRHRTALNASEAETVRAFLAAKDALCAADNAARAAAKAAAQPETSPTKYAKDAKKAEIHDSLYNEGGEGYNPYR